MRMFLRLWVCAALTVQLSAFSNTNQLSLLDSFFYELPESAPLTRGAFPVCNGAAREAHLVISSSTAESSFRLLTIKMVNGKLLKYQHEINIDDPNQKFLKIAKPFVLNGDLYLINGRSNGKVYLSRVNVQEKKLQTSIQIAEYQMQSYFVSEAVVNDSGAWIFFAQDDNKVRSILVSHDSKILAEQAFRTDFEVSEIQASSNSSANSVLVMARVNDTFELKTIEHALGKIVIKDKGKRKYSAISLDQSQKTNEMIGIHAFTLLNTPLGNAKMVYGDTSSGSIFGNNDKNLFDIQNPFPRVAFSRVDQSTVLVGHGTLTRWMIHRFKLSEKPSQAPSYSSFEYWLDTSDQALRVSLGEQLFCAFEDKSFLSINSTEKSSKRGVFFGLFR